MLETVVESGVGELVDRGRPDSRHADHGQHHRQRDAHAVGQRVGPERDVQREGSAKNLGTSQENGRAVDA